MNSRRAREGLTESFLTLLPTSLFTPMCIALRALPSHLLPWVNYPCFGLKPFPPFVWFHPSHLLNGIAPTILYSVSPVSSFLKSLQLSHQYAVISPIYKKRICISPDSTFPTTYHTIPLFPITAKHTEGSICSSSNSFPLFSLKPFCVDTL